MQNEFKILSLNGGGIRGIFQAVLLKKIQENINEPLFKYFDLISGTSTGAIVGASVACGIDINRVVDLYKTHGPDIFKSKPLSGFKKGPRYNQDVLIKQLNEIFTTKQLRDANTKLLIPAVSIDQYSHRVFTNFAEDSPNDKNLQISDVVLSSTSAPTYFKPCKPNGQERSYLDGGLWANSPTTIALLYANKYLDIPLQNIKVLSIGTGEFPNGKTPDYFNNLRPLSVSSIQTILNLMFNSQASFSDQYSKNILGKEKYIFINPKLEENISFDDVKKSIEKLPSLAEQEYEINHTEISKTFFNNLNNNNNIRRAELVSEELICESGLSAFIPSRRHYSKIREKTSSIDSYITMAHESLVMVSINLMTGLPFDGLCVALQEKLERNNKFNASISLLNPDNMHLMNAISPVLDCSPVELSNQIKKSFNDLLDFKKNLSRRCLLRFNISCHNILPFGSAIMIDHHLQTGKIQIETKAYKEPISKSFAFELIPVKNDCLFQSLTRGFENLIADGNKIINKYEID